MTAPRLVCLGRLALDDVVLPDGTRQPQCLGGNAFYAVLGARLWEPRAEMVAPVGQDWPDQAWRQITQAGLSPDGLRLRAAPTLRNEVIYDDQGGRRWNSPFSDQDSRRLSPTPADIPTSYRGAEIFLVKAMDLDAQAALVAWLKSNTQALVALDLKEGYLSGNEARLAEMIARTDIFLPSEAEARHLAKSQDCQTMARGFAALGPRIVAIKLGSNGSFVYDGRRDSWMRVPPCPMAVIDPTGAGDAYCGGFLAMFLDRPYDLETCARAGTISASFAIAGFGTSALVAADSADARRRLAEANCGEADPIRAGLQGL